MNFLYVNEIVTTDTLLLVFKFVLTIEDGLCSIVHINPG